MAESFECQKCGRVYFRMDRTGSPLSPTGDILRRAQTRQCRCGGTVVWVNDSGNPFYCESDDLWDRVGQILTGLFILALWGGIIYGAYRAVMFLVHFFGGQGSYSL